MSKGKNKKQSNLKIERKIEKDRYKFYTMASAITIKENLEDVEFDDLVSGIYLNTNDEDVNYLLKLIEKELLICKLDFEKFNSELHDYYMTMADDIRKKKLFRKFFKLCYHINVMMHKKNAERMIVSAYFNFVMQLNAYLPKTTKKIVYGIKTNDTLMIRDEVMANHTEINDILMNPNTEKMTSQEIFAIYHKYGYKEVKDFTDMVSISMNEQLISNMLFHMSYFINEHNEHMVSLPYHLPSRVPVYSKDFYFMSEMFLPKTKRKLQSREHLLPSDGIVAKMGNIPFIDEILMEETIVEDNIILLYRMKMNGGYLSGYYDTRREIFYSPWKDSDHEYMVHNPLEFLILQMYMYLTCTLSREELESFYMLKKYNVEYDIKIRNESNKGFKREPYDRRKYLSELIDINPFLRHLPIGATASDDAIDMARKLGIELPKGMTLVRGFRRKSWIKGGDKAP